VENIPGQYSMDSLKPTILGTSHIIRKAPRTDTLARMVGFIINPREEVLWKLKPVIREQLDVVVVMMMIHPVVGGKLL
jgi:hypothetical protein